MTGRPVPGPAAGPEVAVVAVVAVVASPGTTERLRPLGAALARRVTVRSLARAVRPAAILAADAAALARAAPDGPWAVVEGEWLRIGGVGAGDGPHRPGDGRVALPLPAPLSVDTAAWPPLPPHVRARWRERLGLAPDLVVDTVALAPEDVPTALAVAAAAVVERPHLALALALGCPVATSSPAAAAAGATDGVHLVVGGRPAADALAADPSRAAALGREGRALAVARLDPARAAAALLAAWGLDPVAADPAARLGDRLEELGTAPGAPVRARAADALALFTGPAVRAPAPGAPGVPVPLPGGS